MYDKEQKGPITAITAVNGYLVATVGQKIYIFQFKNKASLYWVNSMTSEVKNNLGLELFDLCNPVPSQYIQSGEAG